MRRKYNSGGMMKKLNDYPYINTSYQMESNPQGAQQAGNTQQKMADDQNLLTGKKYNMGGYMGVPQSQVPQEGNYAPQDMANSTMLQPPAQEMDPSQQMQSGGYMNQMQQYDNGGMKLPGGNMQPIPGSDAVQFNGNSHDDGGIMLDNQTEVEGGETMDQVNMNKKGGKRDYFFSDHLKKDGQSYASHHKKILSEGGNQDDINILAKMQEHQAGRNPKAVQTAKTGGVKKFKTGGEYPLVNGKEMNDRQKKFHDKSIERGMTFKDGAYTKAASTTTTVKADNTVMNPYQKTDPNYEQWEAQRATADENNVVWVDDPNRAGVGKWATKEDADVVAATIQNELKVEDDNAGIDNTTRKTKKKTQSEIKRDNKYKVASYESYGDNEGEFGTVPDYQPGYKVDGIQMYAGTGDTPFREALQKEDFRGEWMNNVDPEVLESAGITSFADMNDKSKVTAYQNAWNAKNENNQIAVDGLFGEQTFRTAVGGDDPVEEPEETPTEEVTTEEVTTEEKILKKKQDWMTPLVSAAQLLPAMYAFKDTPDYMSEHPMASAGAIIPERIAKTHLDRIDMNPERAKNAQDFASLNAFVDKSGGGPSNMMNKMASYARKQQGDRDIASQESRSNVAISNQEAVMDQQRKTQNVMTAMDASKSNIVNQQDVNKFNSTMGAKVDEFNRGADAATKDRRLNALDNAVKTVAGMNKDRLQYNAQERLAQAISGNTGVYDREGYGQTLIQAGHVPGTDAYNNMMNTYIKSNNATFADGEESSSSSTTTEKTTTKKKYNADGTLQDTEVTTLKKGGFVPTGFRRRYS
jgi:hypothetical protein|tara:strand:- start:10955 stop:13375 length:2421 start_codon:yes stop_codon:yes gene_type:complete